MYTPIGQAAGGAGASRLRKGRAPRAAAGVVLSLVCLVGCRGVATTARNSSTEVSPATNVAAQQAATPPRQAEKADEYLITPERMGAARLGMTVGELKRVMPAATYRIAVLPDTPSAVAVRQGDKDLFYFVTEADSSKLPADGERINFLITNNPRYHTETGVRPGSLLAEAVKANGKAQLYYSPDAEYAKFSGGPAGRLGFVVAGPGGRGPAGIYQMIPENLTGGYYSSERFREGATISHISISHEPSAADAEAAPVAEPLRPALSQLKGKASLPVLLPSQLPPALIGRRMYVDGEATPEGYSIALTSRPNCGANACIIGYFEATRGGKTSFEKAVELSGGTKGYYKPLSCGGSCSPPAIEWLAGGVLYSIQLDISSKTRLIPREEERQLIEVANSAINAGPR